jgi:site-specific DNA-methyltransferase (adenine-specific)
MAVRIEDAGFEIRDMIAWVYGSGFPKSHDVSKAIDKTAGAEREIVGTKRASIQGKPFEESYCEESKHIPITAPATPAAKTWQGWGTALKPALEPITVARKPFTGTVAANVLEHGTGAINVDGCRVGRDTDDVSGWSQSGSKASENWAMSGGNYARDAKPDAAGRFPANLIHDGSDEVVGLFPESSGGAHPNKRNDTPNRAMAGRNYAREIPARIEMADFGSAARFFYCAKASKRDRDEGCEGIPQTLSINGNKWTDHDYRENGKPTPRTNYHPTVKPTDLMRYLCRLVTPANGTVLDPFMGSGSTGKAAILEGFQFIGIDMTPEYVDIARARIEHAFKNKQNTLDL